MSSNDDLDTSERELQVFARHHELREALSIFGDSCEALSAYLDDPDNSPPADGDWWIFMGALASVAWSLRAIFEGHNNPGLSRSMDPLRTYEAVCKRIADVTVSQTHPFEFLLASGGLLYVPTRPGAAMSASRSVFQLEVNVAPPEGLIQAIGRRDSYPQQWSGKRSAERDAWDDIYRLAFCVAVIAKRERNSSRSQSLGDFAQQHLDDFYDDPIALFFVALGLSDSTTGSRQRNLLAQHYARMVIHRFPDQPGPLHLLARSLLETLPIDGSVDQESILEEAESLATHALLLDPSHHKFYFTRARIRLERHNIAGADDDLGSAKELAILLRDRRSSLSDGELARYDEFSREIRRRARIRREFGTQIEELRHSVELLRGGHATEREVLPGAHADE
jgi:hypothetical protein